MDEDRFVVGTLEYANHTTLHPLGLMIVLVCGFAMLVIPRRFVIWPIAVIACLVAPAQRLVVIGLDFDLLRIATLFVWTRIILRSEHADFRWRLLDAVMVAWAGVSVLTWTLLTGEMSAFVNRLGLAFDAIGAYFAFRCLVRTWEDVDTLIQGFILVSIPVSLAFLVESSTGRNLFAFFGGVPEITVIREGKLRCQGAFAHPILAGCFWAGLIPLFAAVCWRRGLAWVWGSIGLGSSMIVIVTCASSTPVMAVLLAVLGAGLFVVRQHMRLVRWGLLCVIIGLHFVMKAPVWHLVSRIDVVGGSTGWHRFHLIDQAIRNVGEWWLLGVQDISHWDVWANDVTNQYVFEGIMGGFGKLALFVAAISLAFAAVGRLWRSVARDRHRLALSWALGVSLFVHVMNFWSVSYFGQITIMWYLSLAIVASLAPDRVPAVVTRRAQGARASPAELGRAIISRQTPGHISTEVRHEHGQ